MRKQEITRTHHLPKIDWSGQMSFKEENNYDNLVDSAEPDDEDDEGEYESGLSDLEEISEEDLPDDFQL